MLTAAFPLPLLLLLLLPSLRPVLRATVNSTEYHDFMQRQKKPSDKAQALEVKGVIADTSSTYFLDLKWSLDTLAPFVSAIREVRQRLQQTSPWTAISPWTTNWCLVGMHGVLVNLCIAMFDGAVCCCGFCQTVCR